MTRRSTTLSDALYDYLLQVSLREPPAFARLRAETAAMPLGTMQTAPEQAQFIGFLTELIGARLCLELGTFTGYSALWIAAALPADGRLICCDINAETTAIAERAWREAGLADRIELRLGPALEILAALERDYAPESFDLVYIDADKTDQDQYYERALRLVRKGGLILIDNVLWSGRVADPAFHNRSTRAIRQLNQKLHDDDRISLSLLPIGDGLSLARKRRS
ncbi:MAG TPA: class I SAM-dependent methyltransferase [Stellaceae bacterium]|nr:class I SAM-dependent methyltransferase [Stellaceae bacterium]